ncbi:DUF368 domain-containing protein [Gayadomonas joobiniege]|uniref:DUF368 domain-containing protein n=1 Tax=Gayadomonas joobiniege TaxID=1234606 RepID=UPI00037D6226|nr:DUF368 domain-containing protein [Gayadomonas joobiniege]
MEKQQQRSKLEYFILLLKGMAMGAADVVPGVSGGTIAFISGIYDELIGSLNKLGFAAVGILFKQGFKAFWQHINGNFLVAVFGGILISLKTFAAVILVLLHSQPLLVWGFFSGLILASIYLLVKSSARWRMQEWLALLTGSLFVYWISISRPSQLSGEPWIMFLGGFVAICAMILPGISGSFILLLVGLYPLFIIAIDQLDLLILAAFGLGAISGLLVFSKFLSWLLKTYHNLTIALLTGFLIGSLNVTWPWKQTLETFVNRHGEEVPLIQQNISPFTFTDLTGTDHRLVMVIFMFLLGIGLIVGLEKAAYKLKGE